MIVLEKVAAQMKATFGLSAKEAMAQAVAVSIANVLRLRT